MSNVRGRIVFFKHPGDIGSNPILATGVYTVEFYLRETVHALKIEEQGIKSFF